MAIELFGLKSNPIENEELNIQEALESIYNPSMDLDFALGAIDFIDSNLFEMECNSNGGDVTAAIESIYGIEAAEAKKDNETFLQKVKSGATLMWDKLIEAIKKFFAFIKGLFVRTHKTMLDRMKKLKVKLEAVVTKDEEFEMEISEIFNSKEKFANFCDLYTRDANKSDILQGDAGLVVSAQNVLGMVKDVYSEELRNNVVTLNKKLGAYVSKSNQENIKNAKKVLEAKDNEAKGTKVKVTSSKDLKATLLTLVNDAIVFCEQTIKDTESLFESDKEFQKNIKAYKETMKTEKDPEKKKLVLELISNLIAFFNIVAKERSNDLKVQLVTFANLEKTSNKFISKLK